MTVLKSLMLAAALVGASFAAAQAAPVTYIFSGEGSGTANGTAFTGAFTFTLNGDTGDVQPDAPFFRLFNVGGTFTEGAFSATLDPSIIIVASANPIDRINFFNNTVDNGLGLQDGALASYDLTSSIGPITVSNPAFLTPTFNALGHGFATSGGLVEITENTSLTFTAIVRGASVPEPASLAILGAGLLALGFVGRRKKQDEV